MFAIALKPWLPAGHVMELPPTVTVKVVGADQMFAARSVVVVDTCVDDADDDVRVRS